MGRKRRLRASRPWSANGETTGARVRYRTVACVVLVAGAALAACGSDDASEPAGGDSAPADGYPVTVENCGRTLTLDAAPSRVLLNYHPEAEIFVGLGLADLAIGRAGYEGALSTPPILKEQAADLAKIPVVTDNNYPPLKEQLLTMRPDFMLGYGIFDVGGDTEGVPGLATMEQLEAAGVTTYLVTCPDGVDDPGGGYGLDTLDATYRSILDIGRIFGVSERAEKRVADMKAQIASVQARVASDPLKVFVYGGGTGPVQVGGGKGIISELLQAAGAENVFADEGQYFEASLESVAARPADAFMIFADYEEATKRLDAAEETAFLFGAFPNMPASKNQRVAVTDYVYTAPGWRIADTAEDLARQLHPAAFDTPSRTQQHSDPDGGG